MKQYPHILIVDDEDKIRVVLRATFDMDGYTISEAKDGYSALKLLEYSEIDAMVLDLHMPVLDGFSVLAQMDHMDHKPKTVVLTAYGSIGTALKATQMGAMDFLEKPVMPNDLRQAVRRLLAADEPASQDQPPLQSDTGEGVLVRVRAALQISDQVNAEALLMALADRSDQRTPQFFNLLGVLYSVQGKQLLAERCFTKAAADDPQYEPAKQNLRRLEELRRNGTTDIELAVGAQSPAPAKEPRVWSFFRDHNTV